MWRTGRGNFILAWDQACKRYLESPDEVGFRPFLAGGEEDYQDEEEERREYCRRKRLEKADVILKRLLAAREWMDCQIPIGEADFWHDKLRENDMALTLLEGNVKKTMQVVEIYEEAGLWTGDNCRSLLERISPECVELRALLLARTPDSGLDEWDL